MTADSTTTVLVVEDEAIVAQDLKETLEELGYHVSGLAATSEEALRSVAERAPDLVLMDIRIRGTHDGIATAGFLRERFEIPVIYLSANSDEATRRRALESEPCGYLRKPVQPADLQTAIELAVFRSRRQRQWRSSVRAETEALRAIGNAVVSVDRSGRVTYMNAAAEDLTGMRSGDATGRPLSEIVESPDRQRHTTPVQVVLQGRAPRHAAEVALGSTARQARIVSEEAFAVRGEAGIEGAVVVLRDVTAERATQQQAELGQRLASLSTMAAGVAHGVNTPLSVILANAAFIAGEVPAGDSDALVSSARLAGIREAAGELEAAARAIATIIADLRAFARATPAPEGEADVAAAVGAAVRATAQRLATRARLDLAVPPGLRAQMDGRRLADVLTQLLANAADAIVPGRPDYNAVRVVGDVRGEQLVLEVQDTGVGIAPELLGRVFDPFFTTKDVGAGSGLGLAVCHGAVAAAGGRIEVDSTPGRGTTFRVWLPGRLEAPRPSEPATPAAALRGRVLVVDDEPLILRATRRVLKDHDLVCVDRPEDALAMIARGERFDVILSDLMMPGLTGMDLHERIAAIEPALARRIVFITGGAVQPDVAQFLASTANPWREKPMAPDELRALVQERLRALGPWPG